MARNYGGIKPTSVESISIEPISVETVDKDDEPYLSLNENEEKLVEAVKNAPVAIAGAVVDVVDDMISPSIVSCPACGSNNVSISVIKTGEVTNIKGPGLGGHVNNFVRKFAAGMTVGMSNIVWKESKGTMKTAPELSKICVCQTCGHDWIMKKAKGKSAPLSIFR